MCVEFDRAIDLKNNKIYGVDEIPSELLKYTNVNIKNELSKICNLKEKPLMILRRVL